MCGALFASGVACGGRVRSGFTQLKPPTGPEAELGPAPKAAPSRLMSKKIAIYIVVASPPANGEQAVSVCHFGPFLLLMYHKLWHPEGLPYLRLSKVKSWLCAVLVHTDSA